MSDITISYKGSSIATMDATGTKTLLTEGKYCEDDITIDYTQPSGGGGISWTEFTAASSASNGAQCLDILFPNRDDRNNYFASLKSKDISDWVNCQLLICHYYSNGHANGERYRNSGVNGGAMQSNYDFVIEIGDTFWISEVSKA